MPSLPAGSNEIRVDSRAHVPSHLGSLVPRSPGSPSPSPDHQRLIDSPFLFNRKTTSDLGWSFVGLIDGGQIREYGDDIGWAGSGAGITWIYRRQLVACAYEVLPGPGKLLPWGVPASRGHDDLISTALTTRLDEIDWRPRGEPRLALAALRPMRQD